jgi:hypothetical protein
MVRRRRRRRMMMMMMMMMMMTLSGCSDFEVGDAFAVAMSRQNCAASANQLLYGLYPPQPAKPGAKG